MGESDPEHVGKNVRSEPLSTDIDRFTPEQQSKKDILLGEHMPVNPNHLTPEQRSKADVYVGENALAGQYVPSKVTPSGALTPEEQSKRRVIVGEDPGTARYIDDMTQTFGGMSEGLEDIQEDKKKQEDLNTRADELMDNIKQFYLDKANRNMDVKDFLGKYPYGSQQMQYWISELTEIIGPDGCNRFVSSWSKIEEGREKQKAKTEEIQNNEEIAKNEAQAQKGMSNVSYNQFGDPIEPDHYDSNINMIMNKPVNELSDEEWWLLNIANDNIDLINQAKEQQDIKAETEYFEAGKDYVADISEEVDIDEESLNEVVNAALYDGPLGEQYIQLIKNGARREGWVTNSRRLGK